MAERGKEQQPAEKGVPVFKIPLYDYGSSRSQLTGKIEALCRNLFTDRDR